MITGLCHSGSWGSLGDFGGWGWVGLILFLLFWIGSIAGVTLLVRWALKRSRVSAGSVAHAAGQPTAGGQNTPKEILQAQYARGEITRQQYELGKQDVG